MQIASNQDISNSHIIILTQNTQKMDLKNLSQLTNEQLRKKRKELINNKITDRFLVGFTFGIFLFALYYNGFGFFTFFPLIIGYQFVKKSQSEKLLELEVEKEFKATGLSL